MKIETEAVKIEGFNFEDIFNKEFLDKLEKVGNIFPVNLIFLREEELEDKKKNVDQIHFSRRNEIERKEGIVHLESTDSKVLEEILKVIKK